MTNVNVNVHVDDSTDVVGKVVEHGSYSFAVLKVGPVDIFTATAGRDAILKFTADVRRALDTIRAQVGGFEHSPGMADLAQREADERQDVR